MHSSVDKMVHNLTITQFIISTRQIAMLYDALNNDALLNHAQNFQFTEDSSSPNTEFVQL